jgi:hypothetical protein
MVTAVKEGGEEERVRAKKRGERWFGVRGTWEPDLREVLN